MKGGGGEVLSIHSRFEDAMILHLCVRDGGWGGGRKKVSDDNTSTLIGFARKK